MDSQLLIIITRLITPFFITLWIFFLLDFKEPKRRLHLLYFILTVAMLIINGVILLLDNGNIIYDKYWPLTFTLPFVIMAIFTTERTPFYSLFTILTHSSGAVSFRLQEYFSAKPSMLCGSTPS